METATESSAVAVDAIMAADAAAMTTVVCGSSSFSAAAEAGEITTVDAVVETAVDVIPADAEKPKDARVKSGKYIKSGTWPN